MGDRLHPVINLDALTPRLITAPPDESPEKYQGAMVAPISHRIGAQKLGYNVTGEEFDEVTIPHFRMEKNLI